MVTYATLIYFFLIPSGFSFEPAVIWRILWVIASGTILIPLMTLLFFRFSGVITSLRMEEQKERNWPLLFGVLIYLGIFYIVQSMRLPVFIQVFLLGAIAGIILSLLINLKWKISLHMIGIGGLCGGTAVVMLVSGAGNPLLLAGIFFLAGLLGTARLYLNAHTPSQILGGFLTGFFVQFVLLFVMLG
jgi:membrane-associated phospholipid phosphatase